MNSDRQTTVFASWVNPATPPFSFPLCGPEPPPPPPPKGTATSTPPLCLSTQKYILGLPVPVSHTTPPPPSPLFSSPFFSQLPPNPLPFYLIYLLQFILLYSFHFILTHFTLFTPWPDESPRVRDKTSPPSPAPPGWRLPLPPGTEKGIFNNFPSPSPGAPHALFSLYSSPPPLPHQGLVENFHHPKVACLSLLGW